MHGSPPPQSPAFTAFQVHRAALLAVEGDGNLSQFSRRTRRKALDRVNGWLRDLRHFRDEPRNRIHREWYITQVQLYEAGSARLRRSLSEESPHVD